MLSTLDNALLLFAVPIVAVVCIALNLFIRARGNRTLHVNLKAFGIELTVVSDSGSKSNASTTDTGK